MSREIAAMIKNKLQEWEGAMSDIEFRRIQQPPPDEDAFVYGVYHDGKRLGVVEKNLLGSFAFFGPVDELSGEEYDGTRRFVRELNGYGGDDE